MDEIIQKIGNDEILALAGMLVGVVAILAGMAVAMVIVVSHNRRRTQRDEMEATLKLEMVQRGMSAGEIAQVLEARMGPDPGKAWCDFVNMMKAPPAPKFGQKVEPT
jgi:hypothetical protein